MKNRYSLATVCFGWLIILAISFFIILENGNKAIVSTIGYDVAGYYEYLPAIFVLGSIATSISGFGFCKI
ncbi:MAG: hypothetical protein IPG60_15030 [Bacteroidetes bacterium]|nr:hypothetical protein [Bacteroidota bacterium]